MLNKKLEAIIEITILTVIGSSLILNLKNILIPSNIKKTQIEQQISKNQKKYSYNNLVFYRNSNSTPDEVIIEEEINEIYHQRIPKLKFLKHLPHSIKRLTLADRVMNVEEGKKFYFDGILPLVENADNPTTHKSEFNKAIKEGKIYDKHCCATCNSQILKYAAKKSGLEWISKLFKNPAKYNLTHNNEYQLIKLGWSYFNSKEYIAPPGAVGLWSREEKDGVYDHSKHIFIVFKDNGNGKLLIGDNWDEVYGKHGHSFGAPGRMVGFYLPPGIEAKYKFSKMACSD